MILCGCSSVAEHLLPKQRAVGSNPISRSIANNKDIVVGNYDLLSFIDSTNIVNQKEERFK